MWYLVPIVFALLIAVAAAFAAWPILRNRRESATGRAVLTAAVVFAIAGIGGGLYIMLGRPQLAVRALAPMNDNDLSGLVARLTTRVRQTPDDPRGWALLGRGYLTLGDARDAAAAFRRAIAVAPPNEQPVLLSAEGEALTEAAGGIVTPEAEAAFREVLRTDPKDDAARYYLGLAYAMRRDNAHAMALWQGLLADAPASAPWRGMLIDRIAALRSQSGTAPNISAMVASLAQRLRGSPNDPEGWQRLVRAYTVLGDEAKAHAALNDARKALSGNAGALAALSTEAQELKLEK